MKPVRKVVFPVNGLGTRFLPATKAMPKEMLPVVDMPLIQYAVAEAAAAGITEMIFVTGRNKRAIEDHFDSYPELERELEEKGKDELLELVRGIVPAGVKCIYIRQPKALGLGHAVLCAKPVVGDEPFGVMLADDLVDAPSSCIGQLTAVREARGGGSVIAVQDVAPEATNKYGIVSVDDTSLQTSQMRGIVEKPDPKVAPSRMAVIGRYVFEPSSTTSRRSRLASAVKSSSPTASPRRSTRCRPTPTASRARALTAAASRASLTRPFTSHASAASRSTDPAFRKNDKTRTGRQPCGFCCFRGLREAVRRRGPSSEGPWWSVRARTEP